MAKTLAEINAQLNQLELESAKLRNQAEEIRNAERARVIESINKTIADYSLTAAELKLSSSASKRSKEPIASKAPAKYRGPNGEGWSGGRGRKPAWVAAALAGGRSLAEFAIEK